MAEKTYAPEIDPNDKDVYFFVWCDRDGTNDGSASDNGELQGATISSYTLTPTGITIDSDNKNAITIHGVSYAINTVVSVKVSAAVIDTDASIRCHAVFSDAREKDKTIYIPVRSN